MKSDVSQVRIKTAKGNEEKMIRSKKQNEAENEKKKKRKKKKRRETYDDRG